MHRLRARTLLFIAAALLAITPMAALAAQPRKGAGYQGLSSQKAGPLALPSGLRVSKDGKKVSRFDIQWSAKCQDPAGRGVFGGLSVTLNKAISKSGSFTDNGSFTRDLGGNQKGTFTIKVVGKFSSKTKATGTFNVAISIIDATTGAAVDSCNSGNVTWSVSD